jgi:hypothetical protein
MSNPMGIVLSEVIDYVHEPAHRAPHGPERHTFSLEHVYVHRFFILSY